MRFCAHQGFAGSSACILEISHAGAHSYGNLAAAIAKDRERDADRYRWLRDGNNDLEGLLPLVSGSDLDAAIDAAMLETPNGGSEPTERR